VGGYRELVKALAAGLDVRLSMPVRSIFVDDDGVLVVTDDGVEHRASHVVVTVPLGVLKSRRIEFSPPLHPDRLSAIDGLGFGGFDKLVLLYDQPYWRDAGFRHLVLTPSDSAAPVHALLGVDEVAGEPIVIFFAFGSTHGWLEGRDIGEAVPEAHRMLCDAVGRELPPPIGCLRSAWKTDEWTQGAYTYLKAGSSYEDLEMLGVPHAGRVLFAGEATGAARTGYVDGAILTGVREAKRLLDRDAVTLARR
jgi:monoamine oxidase